MLSICIPIYNFDVRALIEGLSNQMEQLSVPAEIVLIDDCSDISFKDVNNSVCERHNYYKLESNVGRAKIRNLFLSYAKYEYLLFLDCDATLISSDLLIRYSQFIKKNKPQVICGGSIYPQDRPQKSYRLRWKNGNIKETISSDIRQKKPYSSFMTSNVIINRSVFEQVKFDETLVKYGHEDTLFGYELKKKGIRIYHFSNPVLNDDLDTNTIFLKKTDEALYNLASIAKSLEYDKDFTDEIKLIKAYLTIEKYKLTSNLLIIFSISQKPIRTLLKNGFTNLKVFDFYKLGVFTKAMQKLK